MRGSLFLLFDRGRRGVRRPFDGIEGALGGRVIVTLKTGDQVSGTLARYDEHMNLWMEDATYATAGKSLQGAMVVRGRMVEAVSPA